MGSSASPEALKDVGDELHVLAVDDSVIDRKLVERLLRNSAYKVTTVESGLQALEFLGLDGEEKDPKCNNDSEINLIITDYCMPGMSGYELLKIIKNFFPCKESSTMREIPVVVMSSENIPTRINKCLEGGAKEFMLKPLQKSDVNRLRCHMKKFSSRCNGRACLRR